MTLFDLNEITFVDNTKLSGIANRLEDKIQNYLDGREIAESNRIKFNKDKTKFST